MSEKIITHFGTISRLEKEKLFVVIHQTSACGSCDAKGSCNMSENTHKELEVELPQGRTYLVGEMVEVKMLRSSGLRAVVWGYLMPFVVLITALFVFFGVTNSEGLTGLLALLSLAPYFLGLYFFRHKISTSFKITLV